MCDRHNVIYQSKNFMMKFLKNKPYQTNFGPVLVPNVFRVPFTKEIICVLLQIVKVYVLILCGLIMIKLNLLGIGLDSIYTLY